MILFIDQIRQKVLNPSNIVDVSKLFFVRFSRSQITEQSRRNPHAIISADSDEKIDGECIVFDIISLVYSIEKNNMPAKKVQNRDGNTEKSSEPVNGSVPRAKRISRSTRAGLVFPVVRIHQTLKKNNGSYKVRSDASVYMAAALEYLVAEVTELAGDAAHDHNRQRITPRHIFLAIHNDKELSKLCENVMIASGGVLPHIHQALILSKNSSQITKGDVLTEHKQPSNRGKGKKNDQQNKTKMEK